jgi:hypothetical protein
MKRILFLLAIAALALPATTLAKGPSEAKIDGPGLGKAITITGAEEPGSPLMNFAQAAGFFPAAFSQVPTPMLPGRPQGNLGPKYSISYTVPGPEGESFDIHQDLYPYAKPYAVTYMPADQKIFDMTTRGGWFQDASLKDTLVSAGLPATAPSGSTDGSSSFPIGLAGGLLAALLLAAATTVVLRRRARPTATA